MKHCRSKISIVKRCVASALATSLLVLGCYQTSVASGLTEITLNTTDTNAVATDNRASTDFGSERRQSATDEAVPDFTASPLLITISLAEQQMTAYRGLSTIMRTQISSGKKGHQTPTGIFSILEKRKRHRSNIYNNASMPYMQRLTWSGIALHEGRVPPYPASHGCVRLPKGTAKELFAKTRYGNHVIISQGELSPRTIFHDSLFQPSQSSKILASLRPVVDDLPADLSAAKPETPENSPPLRIYATRTSPKDKTRTIQQMLNDAGYPVGEPDGIYGRNTIRVMRLFQKIEGLKVTGTASDEAVAKLREMTGNARALDGKLYVRQKQKPIYEIGFAIKNAKQPLGTHLALVAALTDNRADWVSVTVPTRLKKSTLRDHGIDETYAQQKAITNIATVLDRLELPQEARDFISKRLSEGSSFAISDNGLGTETGKGTDFIVQTR